MTTSFTSIAPGRLCLFGEHQDYLGLPVISMALPLYCRIHVDIKPSQQRVIILKVPSLESTTTYDLNHLPHQNPSNPDFALAALEEAINSGWQFPACCQVDCKSTCDFVMNAGCSSSSAFCVAWVQVLARLARRTLSPIALAQRAHQAEVTHFGAPGGTMDHVTSAVGGILRIGPDPWQVERLPQTDVLGVWVLAYSGDKKDTLGHLKRCKTARLDLLRKLGGNWNATISLNTDELKLLNATRINRDTESKAAQLWKTRGTSADDSASPLGPQLGRLMMKHHEALRDGLQLSTDRLEQLNVAAHKAGAWGFKVVGSGGGGCGVAWSSKPEDVAESMKGAGAPMTWIITQPSDGARIVEEDNILVPPKNNEADPI
jgi:galactokinase